MEILRKQTRPVKVGFLTIGGGNPIPVQTMWKEPLSGNIEDIVSEIRLFALMGCGVIRFAVVDMESADMVGKIAAASEIAVVADIHFDYKLALRCLETPIDKVRINPGNLGAEWKVREVLNIANDRGKAIRVGINGGSLPSRLRKMDDRGAAMLIAAEEEVNILEQTGFRNAVFSLKSSDLEETAAANEGFSGRFDYPLHIGLTEAGPLVPGIVRNSIALSGLIRKGIGDTVRVSLSDSPANEIIAGKAILSAENVYQEGLEIISCPTCGRKTFDVSGFLREIEGELHTVRKRLTIAVMGCEVNGPGEAKHADLGITGAGNSVILFRKGEILKRTGIEEGKKLFLEELKSI